MQAKEVSRGEPGGGQEPEEARPKRHRRQHAWPGCRPPHFFFFFFTLVAGPRRSVSLTLGDTRVYGPQIRARLGTTAHFSGGVVLELRTASSTACVARFLSTSV